MTETVSLLEQYVDYIPSIGYDYRKNPWYGYINQDTSYQSKNEVKGDLSAVSQFLQVLIPLQQEISEKYKIQCTSVEDAQLWNSFFSFAATSKLIIPSLLDRERFDAVNSALHKLQAQSADIMAAGIMAVLRSKGIRIPDDISIVGFDDISLAQLVTPPLTTIHQDMNLKGRLAVDFMLQLLDGKPLDTRDISLPTRLIERDSVRAL